MPLAGRDERLLSSLQFQFYYPAALFFWSLVKCFPLTLNCFFQGGLLWQTLLLQGFSGYKMETSLTFFWELVIVAWEVPDMDDGLEGSVIHIYFWKEWPLVNYFESALPVVHGKPLTLRAA